MKESKQPAQPCGYPLRVCHGCGSRAAGRAPFAVIWNLGVCDLCGRETGVAAPMDFGFPDFSRLRGALQPVARIDE